MTMNKQQLVTYTYLFLAACSLSIPRVESSSYNNPRGGVPPPPPPPPPPLSGSDEQWHEDYDPPPYIPPTTEEADSIVDNDSYPYNQQQQQQQQQQQTQPRYNEGFPHDDMTRQGDGSTTYYYDTNKPQQQQQQQQQQQGTKVPHIPIHYEFPSTMRNDDDEESDAANSVQTQTASPRKDLITQYMSSKMGKFQVYSSATLIGGSTGVALAKSFIPVPSDVLAVFVGGVFLVGSLFRTPFGELTRALGLSLLLVLQRYSRVRRTYPTWRYVGASVGLRRRPRPFPPARNPWRYTPRDPRRDVPFNMWYTVIAMALVGSSCGGNIRLPLFPTWIGALGGVASFSLGCTLQSPRGDLCRTLGMRVVALVEELWDIQAQLRIIPKAAVVSSQVLDKLMIFDRKHKVKDRFLSLVTKGYDQAMEMATQIPLQQQGGAGDGERHSTERGNRRDEREGPRRRGNSNRFNDNDYRERRPSSRDGGGSRDYNRDRDGGRDYVDRPRGDRDERFYDRKTPFDDEGTRNEDKGDIRGLDEESVERSGPSARKRSFWGRR